MNISELDSLEDYFLDNLKKIRNLKSLGNILNKKERICNTYQEYNEIIRSISEFIFDVISIPGGREDLINFLEKYYTHLLQEFEEKK